MKKIAIINGSEVLGCIINFFKNKNVDITAVSSSNDSIFEQNKFDLILLYGSANGLNKSLLKNSTILRLHPSLLPAFDNNEPVKSAFLAGVKVSGVTVCSLDKDGRTDKIIAQFPVLIDYDTHFDAFEENIRNTESMLYPVVIQSVLQNKPFSFTDIMGGCNGGCGGCKG